MAKKYNIAIVGATGAVGTAMIDILEESSLPIGNLFFVASERSKNKVIKFRGSDQDVYSIEDFDFKKIDIAMFSAGAEISEKYVPIATKSNTIVIDNTSQYRYEDNIPLIVPEVNANVIPEYKNTGIIANPNCSTIQMLVALKPLHDEFVIERIDVTTFQAVSGTGKMATEELINQLDAYKGNLESNSVIYAKPIANNVLPHCDEFEENRYTKEENKLVKETKKILDPNIKVAATCVRVPVLNGHSESVHIKTKDPISEDLALKLLKEAPGLSIKFGESEDDYPTAFTDGDGNGLVHVGRIRKDLWEENRLNLWVVADNLLKGAALNSIQIATLLFD